MYEYYNPNPYGKSVGDCAVRALSKALDKSWDEIYIGLVLQGFLMKDMPSANSVWGTYLYNEGFDRETIPPHNWMDYTVEDFAKDHPEGTYILGCSGHVLCIKDSIIWDSWDSRNEIPIYVWSKTKQEN